MRCSKSVVSGLCTVMQSCENHFQVMQNNVAFCLFDFDFTWQAQLPENDLHLADVIIAASLLTNFFLKGYDPFFHSTGAD
jgi:hypothetical protein